MDKLNTLNRSQEGSRGISNKISLRIRSGLELRVDVMTNYPGVNNMLGAEGTGARSRIDLEIRNLIDREIPKLIDREFPRSD